MMKKCVSWGRKYKEWSVENWKEAVSSDETHIQVQGYMLNAVRSAGEPVRSEHFQQTIK
jgi:hypothetical protein